MSTESVFSTGDAVSWRLDGIKLKKKIGAEPLDPDPPPQKNPSCCPRLLSGHLQRNCLTIFPWNKTLIYVYTVEPLIAATFTAKVRWPLLGGGCYSEVYYKVMDLSMCPHADLKGMFVFLS